MDIHKKKETKPGQVLDSRNSIPQATRWSNSLLPQPTEMRHKVKTAESKKPFIPNKNNFMSVQNHPGSGLLF
jgi:hypothetical protein